MRELIGPIVDALESRRSVAVCRVIGRRGSLPMGREAMMLVMPDGGCLGTVGGGCLEAEVYAHARDLIAAGGVRVDEYSLNEVEAGLEGHVCGGTVTILSEALAPDPDTLRLYGSLRALIEARVPAALATRLPSAAATGAAHALYAATGEFSQAVDAALGGTVARGCVTALESRRAEVVEGDSTDRYWIEPVLPRPTAAVFGAGHCGRAIGRLAHDAGFRVLLFDDREPFLGADASPWADDRRCVDFTGPLPLEDAGPDPYYVIVTRGHDHDIELLRTLLPQPAAYLGMIGSRRKRALFERVLRDEGHPPERLQRLRSPMGLDIGADSPEEIAVSVVAEMIAVRRGKQDSGPGVAAPDPSGSTPAAS